MRPLGGKIVQIFFSREGRHPQSHHHGQRRRCARHHPSKVITIIIIVTFIIITNIVIFIFIIIASLSSSSILEKLTRSTGVVSYRYLTTNSDLKHFYHCNNFEHMNNNFKVKWYASPSQGQCPVRRGPSYGTEGEVKCAPYSGTRADRFRARTGSGGL